ncbi:ankyrin repeat domain-containing protein [Candidatus Dependentiae bacterium]|nr:ankyrin repeat domain-containing protein [Candidatus Dependentiae bacterium]
MIKKILYILLFSLNLSAMRTVEYSIQALIEASKKGEAGKIEEIIQSGYVNINVQDITGRTALMWASKFGHVKTVTLLLHSGADVNIKDNYDFTALRLAELNDHEKIIELLNQANARKKNEF